MKRMGLIIVGTGNIAGVLGHYFNRRCEVIAYTMDGASGTFAGKPVVPFEKIEDIYSPSKFDMFVAIGYKKLNHLRALYYNKAKEKGYTLVNYIDPSAILDPTVKLGDNVFIFELNNLQYNVQIGNDVILWSANHIGHDSILSDHVWIASHVVVSGFCKIGDYSFAGVNTAFGDHVSVGKNCLVGMGANVTTDIPDRKIVVPAKSSLLEFEQLSAWAQEMYLPGENL